MLQTFKKVLANSEPSTHGGKADIIGDVARADPTAADRQATVGPRFEYIYVSRFAHPAHAQIFTHCAA
jgi:hypothetical protein